MTSSLKTSRIIALLVPVVFALALPASLMVAANSDVAPGTVTATVLYDSFHGSENAQAAVSYEFQGQKFTDFIPGQFTAGQTTQVTTETDGEITDVYGTGTIILTALTAALLVACLEGIAWYMLDEWKLRQLEQDRKRNERYDIIYELANAYWN